MAKFVDVLSEKSKERWTGTEKCDGKEKVKGIYEHFTGKKWVPPVKDKRGIRCETKIESPEEIAKIMKQKPGYSVDKQGREG